MEISTCFIYLANEVEVFSLESTFDKLSQFIVLVVKSCYTLERMKVIWRPVEVNMIKLLIIAEGLPQSKSKYWAYTI